MGLFEWGVRDDHPPCIASPSSMQSCGSDWSNHCQVVDVTKTSSKHGSPPQRWCGARGDHYERGGPREMLSQRAWEARDRREGHIAPKPTPFFCVNTTPHLRTFCTSSQVNIFSRGPRAHRGSSSSCLCLRRTKTGRRPTKSRICRSSSRSPHSLVRTADGFMWCQVSGQAGVYWWKMGTFGSQWDPRRLLSIFRSYHRPQSDDVGLPVSSWVLGPSP